MNNNSMEKILIGFFFKIEIVFKKNKLQKKRFSDFLLSRDS